MTTAEGSGDVAAGAGASQVSSEARDGSRSTAPSAVRYSHAAMFIARGDVW